MTKSQRLIAIGRACIDWATDTELCHLCGRGLDDGGGPDFHDEDCLVGAFFKAHPGEAAE